MISNNIERFNQLFDRVSSDEELFRETPDQGNKATVVLQAGLTGSTGCVLSYDRVHSVMPGLNIVERRYIPVTEFVAQSNISTHRKVRKERKAQSQKSLNSEEIIRTGTRITQIGRIYTDPGAQRLEKAQEHGDAMIVCLSRLNNHREHKGHREKRRRSVYSEVDQIHSNSFFQAPAFHNFFFSEQIEKT